MKRLLVLPLILLSTNLFAQENLDFNTLSQFEKQAVIRLWLNSIVTRKIGGGFSGGDVANAVGFANGSATAPSGYFTSDNDGTGTGFYRPAADQFAITNNGAQSVVIKAGGVIELNVNANPSIGNTTFAANSISFGNSGPITYTAGAGGHIFNRVLATAIVAPTIASAGTIAPTVDITFISGTAAIATITAPAPISSTGGCIHLIPTGIFTTTTAGNIALATTAVVSRTLEMCYDATTVKWYPSY